MRKILPALSACLILCACGFEPLAGPVMTNLALGGATVVSYSVVGQSPVDYALSKNRGQNCDIRNPKLYGRYCVDPAPSAPADPAVYCYRTIGSPDCSNMIDPHNNGNQPIVGPARSAAGNGAGGALEIAPASYRNTGSAGTSPLTDADLNLEPTHLQAPASPSATDGIPK